MMLQEEKVTLHDGEVANSAMDQQPIGPPRWLKVLVVVLGLGIIGMLVLIVFTIANRAAGPLVEGKAVVGLPASVTETANSDFLVERPAGTTLVSVTGQGNELYFHFRKDAGDIVIILNRVTGHKVNIEIP